MNRQEANEAIDALLQNPELLEEVRPRVDSVFRQVLESRKMYAWEHSQRELLRTIVALQKALDDPKGDLRALHSDTEPLAHAVRAFIRADSWTEWKRAVEEHPELLSGEADTMLKHAIVTARVQGDIGDESHLSALRELLHCCRAEGVDATFARVMQASQAVVETPAGFGAEARQVQELVRRSQRDPRLYHQLVTLVARILARLRPGVHHAFRANLLNDLGVAYAKRTTGDRSADIEKAIACYREALTLYTLKAKPFLYAMVQINLGAAYADLPTGNRTANLEKAIHCYRQALTVYTPEAAPLDCARTKNNLGNAYLSLPAGDRTANLEQAIQYFQQALTIFTSEDAPFEYATTQTNLGNAYASLPTGDRTANLELAIACYQEALTIYTLDAAPFQYAMTQTNLGAAYANLPTGDRAANLEQAIACYQEALRFLTPEVAPLEYANTQNNLGGAYFGLRTGDRTANLELAIACYQEALTIYTLDAAPFQYATVKTNLGVAYANLPTGDRAANLEQTIACYQEALRFLTQEVAPLEYARTQNNLGGAYFRLRTGDRIANLELAIACYQEALRFWTPEGIPFDYAATQINLGNAYLELPSGDRTANLQQAITCYQEALCFWTEEDAPLHCASTQISLGAAYATLPTGDRSANLYQAIHCFQQALTVYTLQAAPFQYAMIHNNLGAAYAKLPTGDRGANLQQAIYCFQQALTVYTSEAAPFDYANTQNNLGNAYLRLPTGDRGANFQKAIYCFQQALTVYTSEAAPFDYANTQHDLGSAYLSLPTGDRAANLEQAIACYHEALRFRTPDAAPFDYAATQNNLGNVYANLPTGDRTANLQQAIAYYQEAIRFYPPQSEPVERRRIARNLGNLHFKERDWGKAHRAYAIAIDAGEVLYKTAATEVAQQAELTEAADLFPNDAYCLARLGRLREAVERLEEGKARALTDALARDQATLRQAAREDRQAFEAACDQIMTLQAEARAMGSRTPDHLIAHLFTQISSNLSHAYQELEAVTNRIRGYIADFMQSGLEFEAIATAPAPERPLVYLITTSWGSLGFIVLPGAEDMSAEHVLWMDDFTQRDLYDLLVVRDRNGDLAGGYLIGQMGGDIPLLQAALDQALPILEERLVGLVSARLQDLGFQQATLIPGGRLSLLPLHAVLPEAVTFSYAPSARVLRAARNTVRDRTGSRPTLLAIGNPLPNRRPLPFARTEVEGIAPLFPPKSRRILCEHEATYAETVDSLPHATHLHFACHGVFRLGDPLHSALSLADNHSLTLQKLLGDDLDLSAVRLVVLSACQTNITNIWRVPDEAVGFPAGLIQAGASTVIGTLWAVSDLSTALLMVCFYREHLERGLCPSHALRAAQNWPRQDVDRPLVIDTINSLLTDLEGRRTQVKRWSEEEWSIDQQLSRLQAQRRYLLNEEKRDPGGRPFRHPYYWAAFSASGADSNAE